MEGVLSLAIRNINQPTATITKFHQLHLALPLSHKRLVVNKQHTDGSNPQYIPSVLRDKIQSLRRVSIVGVHCMPVVPQDCCPPGGAGCRLPVAGDSFPFPFIRTTPSSPPPPPLPRRYHSPLSLSPFPLRSVPVTVSPTPPTPRGPLLPLRPPRHF